MTLGPTSLEAGVAARTRKRSARTPHVRPRAWRDASVSERPGVL